MDKLSYTDHKELAKVLRASELRWFLPMTSTTASLTTSTPASRCAQFNIKHTAQPQHIGTEYAVFSDNLNVPGLGILPREDGVWVVA